MSRIQVPLPSEPIGRTQDGKQEIFATDTFRKMFESFAKGTGESTTGFSDADLIGIPSYDMLAQIIDLQERLVSLEGRMLERDSDNRQELLDLTSLNTAPVSGLIGPSSSTDNAAARWDGTTGQRLQNSLVLIDDNGNVQAETVAIHDVDASHYLKFETASDLTADRTLTFNTGDVDRTISLSGNLTVSTATTLNSGLYTPTLTSVANVAANTAYECQWSRNGDVVTVSGKFQIDPTAGATLTQLGVSLPVASNFTANEQCGGVAFSSEVASLGAAILADAANNRAEVQYISTADTANRSWWFIFQYRVI